MLSALKPCRSAQKLDRAYFHIKPNRIFCSLTKLIYPWAERSWFCYGITFPLLYTLYENCRFNAAAVNKLQFFNKAVYALLWFFCTIFWKEKGIFIFTLPRPVFLRISFCAVFFLAQFCNFYSYFFFFYFLFFLPFSFSAWWRCFLLLIVRLIWLTNCLIMRALLPARQPADRSVGWSFGRFGGSFIFCLIRLWPSSARPSCYRIFPLQNWLKFFFSASLCTARCWYFPALQRQQSTLPRKIY